MRADWTPDTKTSACYCDGSHQLLKYQPDLLCGRRYCCNKYERQPARRILAVLSNLFVASAARHCMRERSGLSACPPGLVTAECSYRYVMPERKENLANKGMIVRISSDEGSDEASIISKLTLGDDEYPARAIVIVPCSKAFVSDSEHDDISSSDASSSIQKNQQLRDSSRSQRFAFKEVRRIQTHNFELDKCRKRPRKRRRLEPGTIDNGGTLVCASVPMENRRYIEQGERGGDSQTRIKKSHLNNGKRYTLGAGAPDSLCVLNPCTISLTRQPQIDWSGGMGIRSHGIKGTSLPVIPGSVVEILEGIFKGRRGIVKQSLQKQVLVRVPAFSFQIDRWFEHFNLRVLRDHEVLHVLSASIARHSMQQTEGKKQKCETKEPQQSCPSVDDLDRIDPLPVNFAEESNDDKDGLAAFVSECFDPCSEHDDTCMAGNHGIEKDEKLGAKVSVGEEGIRTERAENQKALQSYSKRLTPASFDLQDTLDVVSKIFDEVAGAQRVSCVENTDCDHEAVPRSRNRETSTEIGGASVEQPQQSNHTDRTEALNGYVTENISESVDSSIVEAFAPSMSHRDACHSHDGKVSRHRTQANNVDGGESLAHLDHVPTGLFEAV